MIALGLVVAGLAGYAIYRSLTADDGADGSDPYYANAPVTSQQADGAGFKARLDTDGDGTVSDAEREAGRAAMKARMLERFDTDGDGTLSETEREAMKAARPEGRMGKGPRGHKGMGPRGDMDPEKAAEMKAAMLNRFDTDGDGSLSETEREAMKAAHEAIRNDPELGALAEKMKAAHLAFVAANEANDAEAVETTRGALETARAAMEAKRKELLGL